MYLLDLGFSSPFTENPAQGLDTHKSQSSGNRQCPSLTVLWPHLLIQGEAVALTDVSLSLPTVPHSLLYLLFPSHTQFSALSMPEVCKLP